jgi:hypothetical protein
MKTNKDKYNIGLDIIEERQISGNATVTINLIDLFKFEKKYKDALKNDEKQKQIIHNLVNSNKFLLGAIDTE